jgi:hypothetical protein
VPVNGVVETKLSLSAQPSDQPGQFFIDLKLTTINGNPVEEGEILITVSGGNLKPGHRRQALVSAAAGHHRLVWTAPLGDQEQYTLEAAYFGGQGTDWDYGTSSTSITLPPQP